MSEQWTLTGGRLAGYEIREASGDEALVAVAYREERARLIAAAPDLLEAGRRALVFLQDNGLSHGADLARAIAKAEGR